MSEGTRRERIRAATEVEIRQHARTLLIEQGRDAVTLRAIARELGITAPALYRYYDSREDLLRQLGEDICGDLVDELSERLREIDQRDFHGKLRSVCHGFRCWALAHPKEFGLVFATRADETAEPGADGAGPEGARDQFAGVFLRLIGPLMAESTHVVDRESAPASLQSELSPNQLALAEAFSQHGIDLPAEAQDTDAVYFLLRWWVRIYGHVALEVFGRFPFTLAHSDRLYESLLDELAHELGLTTG